MPKYLTAEARELHSIYDPNNPEAGNEKERIYDSCGAVDVVVKTTRNENEYRSATVVQELLASNDEDVPIVQVIVRARSQVLNDDGTKATKDMGGIDTDKMIRDGYFEGENGEEELFTWASQVIHAAQALKKRNLINMDVKPDNVLYDEENGGFKMIDLGILLDLNAFPNGPPYPQYQGVGTRGFKAPEVVSGPDFNAEKAMVFSIAMSIFHADQRFATRGIPADQPIQKVITDHLVGNMDRNDPTWWWAVFLGTATKASMENNKVLIEVTGLTKAEIREKIKGVIDPESKRGKLYVNCLCKEDKDEDRWDLGTLDDHLFDDGTDHW
ncbi:RAC-alpha serine/threonine-protein kinase [Penicillium capsulatum]|uniref:RAC-alpha serine/threonine-protein kinase n=1 Tax=Penicillium capsulatum TaxID=69766 RepID=A0A9W9LL75_9EURO|nr:RAC-alpha serine/threonine-protein kinase [Penicillium capsulatum]KAJ6117644.1 RAC-alpha serine/threonine-protein kinase [Penicillium capsulatum]